MVCARLVVVGVVVVVELERYGTPLPHAGLRDLAAL